MYIRNILFSLLLSILLIKPAFPQCSGPSCPIPSGPGYNNSQFGQNYDDFAFNIDAEVAQKIKKASVRVAARLTARTTAYGSGTIFIWGDSVGILTAGHVVEDASNIRVVHESLGIIPCEVLYYNIIMDYAILEPKEKQEELWQLGVATYSGNPISSGTRCILAGFASNDIVSLRTAVFLRYATVNGRRIVISSVLIVGDINDYINKKGIYPIYGFKSTDGEGSANWMELNGIARSGDSGGGVFTADGKLIGNIWGSDMQTRTLATWIGPLTKEIGKTCIFNWRRRPNPGPSPPGSPAPGPAQPQQPPQVQPPQQPPQVQPPQEQPKPPQDENGDSCHPQAPSEPGKGSVPPEPVFSWFEFLKPTLLVVTAYLSFLISSIIFYIIVLFVRK